MKIISKLPDYYDSVLAFGHDEHVRYVREPVEYVGNQIPDHLGFLTKRTFSDGKWGNDKTDFKSKIKSKSNFIISPHCVAFCGVIYRGLVMNHVTNKGGLYDADLYHQDFFYDKDGLVDYMKKHRIELKVPKNSNKKKYWKRDDPSNVHLALSYERAVEHYFKDPVDKSHLDFFVENRIPAAAQLPEVNKWGSWSSPIHQNTVTVNPILGNWQFYKVFDPYRTFQELEMFIGGVLAGEDNPMEGIADKDLAKAKGYDCMSFRKEPTKRKRKTCKT